MDAGGLIAEKWWDFEWIADPDPVAIAVVIVIILALLLLLVFLDISLRIRHRKQRVQRNWDIFYTVVNINRLIPSETALLRQLVRFAPDANPVNVINSPANFDLCVEGHLTRMAENPRRNIVDETISLISSIRGKLGLDHVPKGQFLRSTHGLAPNQELKISIEGDGERRDLSSSIVRVSEREIMTATPVKGGEVYSLDEGAKIKVEFVRDGDAIYGFRSRVLKNFAGRLPYLFIEHSNNIERKQLRCHFRVDTDCPIRYRKITTRSLDAPLEVFIGEKEWFNATVVNISGGGALIKSADKVEKGDFLNFDFSLDDGRTEINLTCEVIQITGGDNIIVHTAFVGTTDIIRDKIVKFVFCNQIDAIRDERKELEAFARRASAGKTTYNEKDNEV